MSPIYNPGGKERFTSTSIIGIKQNYLTMGKMFLIGRDDAGIINPRMSILGSTIL